MNIIKMLKEHYSVDLHKALLSGQTVWYDGVNPPIIGTPPDEEEVPQLEPVPSSFEWSQQERDYAHGKVEWSTSHGELTILCFPSGCGDYEINGNLYYIRYYLHLNNGDNLTLTPHFNEGDIFPHIELDKTRFYADGRLESC